MRLLTIIIYKKHASFPYIFYHQGYTEKKDTRYMAAAAALTKDSWENKCETNKTLSYNELSSVDEVGSKKNKNIAACVVIRNEAPIMQEWLTFHWIQGTNMLNITTSTISLFIDIIMTITATTAIGI